MHILLCNDDGILAPGLAAMYRALSTIGEVSVAAPDSVQSASGHAITIAESIRVRRVHVHDSFHGWSVGGRPADCVKLAVCELLESPPDLVVSGINDGANVGVNILYSGTVAAAAEGALLGFPSVAVSLEWGDEMDFDRAAAIALRMIDALAHHRMDTGELVNINIPSLRPGVPKGVRVAPQALQGMIDRFSRTDGPDGVAQYRLDGEFTDPEHGGDLHALLEGFVVVTPLKVDLTDRSRMGDLRGVRWPEL